MLKPGDIVELDVDKLSFQGAGVARLNNLVVFVANAAPGDKVLAQITEAKARFANAKIREILKPSSHRRKPPCPYVPTCGGCQWQHIEYAEQIIQKQKMVHEIFSRQLKGIFTQKEIPIVESKEFNYRNRIRLHWDGNKLGMFAAKSREIVDVTNCLIADEKVSQQIASAKESLRGKSEQNIDISTTNDINLQLQPIAELPAFRQVNDKMNERLVTYTLDQIPAATRILHDLYCGDGNFTFEIANKFPNSKLFAVELSSKSIAKAKSAQNQRDQRRQIEFINADVSKYLRKMKTLVGSTVLLDPPRSGCEKSVIDNILTLAPDVIVYVSCDPMTLTRDLSILCKGNQQLGYDLKQVQLFDMFPQTFHVETVVTLHKRHF